MEELLSSIESYIEKHLETINNDLKDKGKFICSQQLDDAKDCVKTILAIRTLESATTKRTL